MRLNFFSDQLRSGPLWSFGEEETRLGFKLGSGLSAMASGGSGTSKGPTRAVWKLVTLNRCYIAGE